MFKHKIDNKNYYAYTQIKKEYTNLHDKCKTGRNFIEHYQIPTDWYTFNKINTNEPSKVKELYIRKKYFINTLCIRENIYRRAPDIVVFDDTEMFHDEDSNELNIEVRGDRSHNELYFKVNDVTSRFALYDIANILTDDTSDYVENVDYVYFQVVNREGGKAKRILYLTYVGILRVLFASRGGSTTPFIGWAVKTLFTAHLGDILQKQQLASQLTGTSVQTLKALCKTSASKIPCIYLLSIGTVDDLAESMNLEEYKSTNRRVYKWGFTNSLKKRTNEHNASFGKLDGANVELVMFGYIDVKFLREAEAKLKKYFDSLGFNIEHKKSTELAIIPTKMLPSIKKHMNDISNKYLGCVRELVETIGSMKKDMTTLVKETNVQVAAAIKDRDTGIAAAIKDRDTGIAAERHLRELVEKDMKILEKEIDALKKDTEFQTYKHENEINTLKRQREKDAQGIAKLKKQLAKARK